MSEAGEGSGIAFGDDWKEVGLRVGIEIHQQLNTHKLFCSCSSDMKGEPVLFTVRRRQHPVPSELGEYDVSALYEELRGRSFVYHVASGESCLVELDEEPPHPINQEALQAALTIAQAFNSWVFDELHVMRKTITDGSNTGAFQRTIMVSMGGYIDAMTADGEVKVPLEGINLEEDAANILWRRGQEVGYGLSRLGIPLVEIGTEVMELSPQAVADVAKGIGLTLRGTGLVKRGLGTIRQDVNVSVRHGKRVEVKGVQDLRSMASVIWGEARRQLDLIKLSQLDLADSVELAQGIVRIKGGARLAETPLGPGSFKREIEDFARAFSSGVEFSTDAQDFVIKTPLGLGEKMRERVAQLLSGPSEETRAVVSGALTTYTRPLPGGARMYPETDLPPIQAKRPPTTQVKPYWVTITELKNRFSVTEDEAEDLFTSPYLGVVLQAASETSIPPPYIASVALGTLKSLSREGIDLDSLRPWMLLETFRLVGTGFPKEGVEELLRLASSQRVARPEDVRSIAASLTAGVDLQAVVADVIARNRELIKKKGMDSYSALMGEVMRVARGKVDGKKISETLKRALEEATSKGETDELRLRDRSWR